MTPENANALLVVLYEITKGKRDRQVLVNEISQYLDEQLKRGLIVVDYIEHTMEELQKDGLVEIQTGSPTQYRITQAGINRIADFLSH